jgi:hypothetical protein
LKYQLAVFFAMETRGLAFQKIESWGQTNKKGTRIEALFVLDFSIAKLYSFCIVDRLKQAKTD